MMLILFDCNRELGRSVHRDAADAVDARNGYPFDGYKLRVEFPRGGGFGGRGRGGGGSYDDRFSGSRGGPRGMGGGPPSSGPARRTDYKVIVKGQYIQEHRYISRYLTITLLKCTLLSTGFYGIIQDKVPHFFNAIFLL